MAGNNPLQAQESVDRFWDRYIETVKNHGVNSPFDRWYVILAEQYIKHFDHKLRRHTLPDLEAYLDDLGGNISLKDWQIRQSVDAIRILLCELLAHPWACSFDWDGWVASLKRLPDNHPTVAREYNEASKPVVDIPRGSSIDKTTPLTSQQQQLMTKMIAVLRRKDYAYRTGQSYCHWRYKSILVDREAYLAQLSRYIHRNPIDMKRTLVEELADYPWSSYAAYVNKTKTPDWLHRDRTYHDCHRSCSRRQPTILFHGSRLTGRTAIHPERNA